MVPKKLTWSSFKSAKHPMQCFGCPRAINPGEQYTKGRLHNGLRTILWGRKSYHQGCQPQPCTKESF